MTKNPADAETLVTQLTSLRDYIRWGASLFAEHGVVFGHGSDNALDEAAHLVLHALQLPHDLPALYFDARLLPDERQRCLTLLRRRVDERRPAAYLTGEAWFAGLPFYVNEDVLIPRSPIAELIEAGFQPWLGELEPERILDLCTGCGAIAVACALAFPDAEVDATDVSDTALAVAADNARRHEVDLRLHVLHSDVFAALAGRRYDLIVSNPPYVGAEELQGLAPEYRHEPRLAFAGGDDGLDVVARMLHQAPAYLSEDGIMVMEVGYTALAMERRWPDLPVTWVDLEHGGVGVGVFEAEDLAAWVAAQNDAAHAQAEHKHGG